MRPWANPNDPDDPAMRQELSGDAKVQHGKVTIPFFPPFSRTPSCSIAEGEVVKDTPEYIQLKNIKHKTVHYSCHGIKKLAGEVQ